MQLKWYTLYTPSPLTFRQRFLDFKDFFENEEQRTFTAEIRTPNEFVSKDASPDKFTTAEARAYLFHYVFIGTDDLAALHRLLIHPKANLHARIMGYRYVKDHPEADITPAADINRFFLFCRSFIRYTGLPSISFIESPPIGQRGDKAIILDGEYKGLKVSVALNQDEAPEGETAVSFQLMGGVDATFSVPNAQLRILQFARHANDKYAVFDDFFFHFTQPEAAQRLLDNAPLETDIAKALRMKTIASTLCTEGPRAKRDSRRLQFVKVSALLFCHHILHDPAAAAPLLPLWHRLAATYNQNLAVPLLLKLYATSQD